MRCSRISNTACVVRAKISEHLILFNELTDQEKPFLPEFIDTLSQSIEKEIDLMRPALAIVAKHRCWLQQEEANLTGNMIVLAALVSLYH